MFVSDWMTKEVFTVLPDNNVSMAITLMKEKHIKHVPVVVGGVVQGLISDRDVREVMPSKATTLDMYELHYLLIKIKVNEVMKTKVFTTAPDVPVEEAAMFMLDHAIGCLPVISRGSLVGIISDKDIFRALVDISGIRHGGHRIYVTLEDRQGTIKDLTDIISKQGCNFQSILISYEGVKNGWRDVVIRARGTHNFEPLKEELKKTYPGIQIRHYSDGIT